MVLPDINNYQNSDKSGYIYQAGRKILNFFQKQQIFTNKELKEILTQTCSGTDADGAWQWKDAYEATEIGLILYLLNYLRHAPNSHPQILADLKFLEKLYPTHTKRTAESIKLQQFSTPISIGYCMSLAAQLKPKDFVLEPSAGNGLLAVFAAYNCYDLALNEISDSRYNVLKQLFSDALVSKHNGEQIDDRLDNEIQPSVILMNPPFSSYLNRQVKSTSVIFEHLESALKRLQPNGRLVLLSSEGIRANNPIWTRRFLKIQATATVVFSAGIDGKAYYKQGASVETRITVIDKIKPERADKFPPIHPVMDLENLLKLVEQLPIRTPLPQSPSLFSQSPVLPVPQSLHQPTLFELQPTPSSNVIPLTTKRKRIKSQEFKPQSSTSSDWLNPIRLEYTTNQINNQTNDEIYQTYHAQNLQIPQAKSHPAPLVESAAMSSVTAPQPTYQPVIPPELLTHGILSDAQLESVIRAGEAHSQLLDKWVKIEPQTQKAHHYNYAEIGSQRERRGWLLGDNTGVGKGRQIATIIADNWLQGRKKAVWISISATLIEDAQRDWQAIGGDLKQIFKLNDYSAKQTIELTTGILFCTYSTLRRKAKNDAPSRVEQIVNWLGQDFEGVIAFDECHAMGGALSVKSSRGKTQASQQGLAGLHLQNLLPNARVVYISATGASKIENLAYAERLGLWGTTNSPFNNREEFIDQIDASGISALEIVSRDLKALGLYTARSLSYDGIEYQTIEHELTPAQIEIYNQYCQAYQIIHNNLEQALAVTNGDRDRQTNSSAYSQFESSKQRFFNQLLIAMECPSLIAAIERNLEAGEAPVLQITSTNEAMLKRKLEDIPVEEWQDIHIDLTPREYVLDYLNNAFPVHLMEITEVEGNEIATFALDEDGNKIISNEAIRLKEELLQQIMLLPPVNAALDQIVFHFGTEKVAEVTGRRIRLVQNEDKIQVETRSALANSAEAEAFMQDKKPILIFSTAGGTGRSYHADLNCPNQRRRIHYLVEPGWNAATAVQGVGRTHRTNQAQPPLYVLLTTNVKGQKRFTSTIARRLDALGAITKGQRETGSSGMFKSEDNLESIYAQIALGRLIKDIYHRTVYNWTIEKLEQLTGLRLTYDGNLISDLPSMTKFLNRLLALEIDVQNELFEHLERRIESNIEAAKATGHYDLGVETIKADSLTIVESVELWQHPLTKAKTISNKILRRDRCQYLSVKDALAKVEDPETQLVFNTQSKNVAIAISTNSFVDPKTGESIPRVAIIRPNSSTKEKQYEFIASNWQPINKQEFVRLWNLQIKELPEYNESTFYLITGLLLPLWDRLDSKNLKIWRLTTDDGRSILGRVVDSDVASNIYREFNQDIKLSPEEIVQAVSEGRTVDLNHRWKLKRSRVAYEYRLEVVGWKNSEFEFLKQAGCFDESINWNLRLFVPQESATEIIKRLET